jgi:hypothetical protein
MTVYGYRRLLSKEHKKQLVKCCIGSFGLVALVTVEILNCQRFKETLPFPPHAIVELYGIFWFHLITDFLLQLEKEKQNGMSYGVFWSRWIPNAAGYKLKLKAV